MNDYGKGGRGKKAPYKTVHYRIPEPIKQTVELLANRYRHLASSELIDEANQILEQVQDTVSNNQSLYKKPGTMFTESELDQITATLEQALRLKANAGGKIKECIKEALILIKEK